ncbi:MAG: NHL repeat-containing protein [Chloroflexi bacterium]|nr:NHL repeat-containing protein [Chloroflexota bacterium]
MTTATEHPISQQGLYQYHDVIGLLSPAGPGFSGPVAVTTGPDGMLYVASRANPNQPDGVRVSRCTKDGEFLGQFGSWGEGPGEFIWVTSLAFSPQGEAYVADEHSHRISIFDAERNFSRSFGEQGSGPGKLDRPSGLAFGPSGNLHVVDTMNHRVQVLTASGGFIAQWGGLGDHEGQFHMPWGVAIDQTGDVYVTDWRNDRVQRFDSEGRFLMAFGTSGDGEGQFNRPNGIAVDSDGDIYVCDWMNDRVQVFDQAGGFKDLLIGHSGMSKWGRTFLNASPDIERKLELAVQNIEPKRRFYRPVSVHVDDEGMVYVADCYRHRVQIYQKL